MLGSLGCCFITSELPSFLSLSPHLPLIHKDHADREGTASFPNIDLERLDRLEQNFTFAANLKDLDTARLPGRLALLEGACLEERLALLESMNTAGVAAQGFDESIFDILVELNQWFFHWFSSNRNGANHVEPMGQT